MKSKFFHQNQKGFTLIELLSVMIIMGVMSSVAVKKVDFITDTASARALELALKELNVRESLIWTNIKLSYDGWTDDSAVFAAVDTDLGPQYNWRPKPKNQRRVWYALSEHILGEVNLQIATGPKPALSVMAKNVGFLLKSVPFATKKAEEHFNKAIELLKEIGANGFLGNTYLSLGLLYKSSKRTDQAKQCILEAIDIFRDCGAEANLKQAKEVFDSLE